MKLSEADILAQSNDIASLDIKATAGAIRQLLTRLEYDASWDKCGPLYYELKRKLAEHDAKTYAEAFAAQQANTVEGERFEILSKERTHRGTRYPGQKTGMFAQIGTLEGRKFIHLTGTYSNRVVDIKFFEGDEAEYDSFNLRYTGKITKITEKCVTILPRYGSGRSKRLDLNTFAWRNHDFDAERVAQQNAETSQYI
jgi:hypothetical protein